MNAQTLNTPKYLKYKDVIYLLLSPKVITAMGVIAGCEKAIRNILGHLRKGY